MRSVTSSAEPSRDAKQTIVLMTLLTRDGVPKLVETCDYPLTGIGCVTRVYTKLAVFLVEPQRVVVRDLFGVDFETLTNVSRCRRSA